MSGQKPARKTAGKRYLLLGVLFLISSPLFSQNYYLELNLNNTAIQNRVRRQPRPDLELFRVIERAGRDSHIRGIVLNVSAYSAGRETLWEVRTALEGFKSQGKKICAFVSAADLDMYCLASVADTIVMDGQGSLSLTGYAWGRGYVLHTLEKLGVGARELRYLEYKSAAETYTRDAMSAADRRQYGEVLDDTFNLTRSTVMQSRSWTQEEFDSLLNNDFMYSAKKALEQKLVDRIGRKDAVVEALKEIEGKEIEGGEIKHFTVYGDTDTSLMESASYYGAGRAGGLFSKPPVIAVVYANGQTDMERGMAARSLARIIGEVSEKRQVKAIVVRINSPGGSAEAADYVAQAITHARKRIPVVVSMGAVAASGGYWASMNASHIVASPYTLTGSIGVIGSWFYDNGLNNKLGFTVDTMQRGEHADLMTGMILPRRDLTAAEENSYRNYIMDLYGDFTAKVAAGRNMSIEAVESVAQGRVFSGIGALNAGLIDSLGGLSDAVRIARELAKIPEGKKVAYSEYPKPKFIDKVLERLPLAAKTVGGKNEFAETAGFFTDLFLPAPLLEDLRYRISHNGQVMPILPLENWAAE